LCMGTMTFGGEADAAQSEAMFHRCLEAGINFFDCADVYVGGESERLLGRFIEGRRDELVITSKVHGPTGEDRNARGLNRRHIMLAVEDSLRRLGTDRLDFYFAHQVDDRPGLEQTLRAFDDLVRQGKVLYPAISNWPAWRIARALGLSERWGWSRPELLQPMYNLLKRQAEVEILPLAASEELGVIVYNPLGGGMLTGKYTDAAPPTESRLVAKDNYARRYGDESYHEVVRRFVGHAHQRGVHPVTLAVAWAASGPAVTSAILGARSVEQLEPALAAAELAMDAEQRAAVSRLAPAPPVATDRREEQV